jgi:Sulfur oxidation protein SoxY
MMRSRRDVFRFTGGALFAGLSGLRPRSGTPGRCRGPAMAVVVPRLARVGQPVSVGVRIELMRRDEHVELIDLALSGRLFPGVARFLCTDQFPIVTVGCQIRLDRSETLVVLARFADGRICTSSSPISIFVGARP